MTAPVPDEELSQEIRSELRQTALRAAVYAVTPQGPGGARPDAVIRWADIYLDWLMAEL